MFKQYDLSGSSASEKIATDAVNPMMNRIRRENQDEVEFSSPFEA
jgi:hypothetical protein